jgi:hypothetical protein
MLSTLILILSILERTPEVKHGAKIGTGDHLDSAVAVKITRLSHAIMPAGMIG